MMNSMNPIAPHFGFGEMGGNQHGPGSPADLAYRGMPPNNVHMHSHNGMDPQQQQQQQSRPMMNSGAPPPGTPQGMGNNGMMNDVNMMNLNGGGGGPMMNSMPNMGCGMNNGMNNGINNGPMSGGPQQPPNQQQQSMGHPGMGHPGMGPPQMMCVPTDHNSNNGNLKACAGCGCKILERFLLHALDRFWHHACLKCSCCGARLAELGASCYTKGGMILCRPDYVRLFGSSGACSACGQGIPASELVMRAPSSSPPTGNNNSSAGGVYHVKCFACTKCQAQLMPGDRYAVVGGSLVCEQDCQKMLKNNNNTSNNNNNAGISTGPVRKGKVGRPRRSRD